MGIEIRSSGEAAAYAQAGQTIGKGERAKEERARQAAMEWEMQKMLLNSQQDFAHEMRMRQAELDKEARAHEWETEKLGLASRFDFEQDEKERLRISATYDAAKNILDEKKENMPDGEYERALFKLDSIYAEKGVSKAVTGLGLQTKTASVAQQKWGMLTPEEQQRLAKKPTEPTSEFGKPPWWTSPEWKDTPEGKATAKHYQNETYVQQVSEAIALMQLNAMGLTPKPANTPTEETTEVPQTEDAFRTEVGRLKATDPQSAKEYYEKHKSKFGYE